jgi:hypothetical protein
MSPPVGTLQSSELKKAWQRQTDNAPILRQLANSITAVQQEESSEFTMLVLCRGAITKWKSAKGQFRSTQSSDLSIACPMRSSHAALR